MNIFNKSVVGLEIDAKEIRAVHLEGKPGKPYLQTFARFPLNEGIVKDGKVQAPDELGVALSTFWSRENIKCREIVLGVNNQDVIVRFADFPKVPKEKLDSLIRFQAQEYIPIPLEEVELDYTITGETSNNDGDFYHVLLVAGRKKMLFDFIEAMQDAHLNILDIGVSILSVTRLIPDELKDLPIAIINLSNDFGNIVIMNKNEPGMARTFNYNAHMTSLIREFHERNVDIEYLVGDDIMERICDTLANEIRSSILYFQNQNPDMVFQNIILTGSMSRVRCLAGRLQTLMDTNIHGIRDIFKENENGVDMSFFQASDYASCISLALRGLEV